MESLRLRGRPRVGIGNGGVHRALARSGEPTVVAFEKVHGHGGRMDNGADRQLLCPLAQQGRWQKQIGDGGICELVEREIKLAEG